MDCEHRRRKKRFLAWGAAKKAGEAFEGAPKSWKQRIKKAGAFTEERPCRVVGERSEDNI